jgi:hypothetical protein
MAFGGGVFGGPGTDGSSSSSGVLLKDLLRSSFRCIGSLGVGFGYSPSELVDGLFVLNAMLDSWVTDELNAYCTLTQSFEFGVVQDSYSIGPGGDFDTGRPVKLLDPAVYLVMTNPAQPLHLPLKIINTTQFEEIALPLTASTIPQRLYYNPTYPLGTLKLWPVVVNTTDKLLLSAWQPIAGNLTDQDAVFSVPPGYLDAVRYQLAVRLAMEWDKPLKPGVEKLAIEALAKIQRLNAPTPQMDVNGGVMPARSGYGYFNRLTGDPT